MEDIANAAIRSWLDDALSDGDMPENFAQNHFSLPQPEMRNLDEILATMQQFHATIPGRDAIAKFVISEDYVRKLIPFVEMAEELESLRDLHCLCSIMKLIILLNDSQIIDHIVNENVVTGVVGALECKWLLSIKSDRRRQLTGD